MKREELLNAVPVRKVPENGSDREFIRIADIPEPWREQFLKSMTGSRAPVVMSESDPHDLAYPWDWREFVRRGRYGIGPTGLED
jgi:hypothetical protein